MEAHGAQGPLGSLTRLPPCPPTLLPAFPPACRPVGQHALYAYVGRQAPRCVGGQAGREFLPYCPPSCPAPVTAPLRTHPPNCCRYCCPPPQPPLLLSHSPQRPQPPLLPSKLPPQAEGPTFPSITSLTTARIKFILRPLTSIFPSLTTLRLGVLASGLNKKVNSVGLSCLAGCGPGLTGLVVCPVLWKGQWQVCGGGGSWLAGSYCLLLPHKDVSAPPLILNPTNP